MNDFTYTVRTGGAVVAATGDLDLARAEAMKAAKAMTAKGGATGHVLIDYWTKGQVTDTEHVYDDGTIAHDYADTKPTESAYAQELRQRHDRIAAGLTAFRSVSPFEGMTPSRRGKTDTALMEVRDHVWGMYQEEIAKVAGR